MEISVPTVVKLVIVLAALAVLMILIVYKRHCCTKGQMQTLDVEFAAVTSVPNNDELRVCFEVRVYQLNAHERDSHMRTASNDIYLFHVV